MDRVRRGDECLGILLPRAPTEFYVFEGSPMTRSFSNLVGHGCPLSRPRIYLMEQLANILDALDLAKLTHGDLSGQNIIWTLDPRPRLLIIDCDGIHPRSQLGGTGYTRFWTDPRLTDGSIDRHDHYSDWYALALAVHRVLVLDERSIPEKDAYIDPQAGVPETLRPLLYQTFQDPLDATCRVKPRIWKRALMDVREDRAVCGAVDIACAPIRDSLHQRRARSVRGIAQPGARVPRDPVKRNTPGPSTSSGTTSLTRSTKKAVPPAQPQRGSSRSFAVAASIAILAIALTALVGHPLLGIPSWRYLDHVNVFLSSSERSLALAMPDGVKNCTSDDNKDLKTWTGVKCEWDGRSLFARKFKDSDAAGTFYQSINVRGSKAGAPSCPHNEQIIADGSLTGSANAVEYPPSENVNPPTWINWIDTDRQTVFQLAVRKADMSTECLWWREVDLRMV